MNTDTITIDSVLEESNAPLVTTGEREQIVATLKPLVANIERYKLASAKIVVTNASEAEAAAGIIQQIAADEKTVEEAINKHKSAAKQRHSLWCNLEGLFLDTFSVARRRIKQAVLSWQDAEEKKAAAEQARLQAIADEAARKEQQRLRKEAANLKTPELKEQRLEQAAAVTAPVIHVAAPTKAVAGQKRWKVKSFDMTLMGIAPEVQGYITVETSKLERGKAANSMLTVPGVVFHQVLV